MDDSLSNFDENYKLLNDMIQNAFNTNRRLNCCGLCLILFSLLLCHFSARADVIVPDADVDLTIRKIKACHFLTQATMGPRIDEIDALAARIGEIGENAAFNEWIDHQFSLPNVPLKETVGDMLVADGAVTESGDVAWVARAGNTPNLKIDANNYRRLGWWDQAINGEDQLRQRMAWALYNIFPAHGQNKWNSWLGSLHYQDMLRSHVFGNYREMLEGITYHPTMGDFLSHVNNDKGDEALGIFPDENYAREIMQLFSIGVYKTYLGGRPIVENGEIVENYTNEDIKELAKVFTGLSDGVGKFYVNHRNKDRDMTMHENHHHTGEKNFLGHTIPAGQPGNKDISDALDILFNYSTTAPFISRRLIQFFTCSSPRADYVKAVAKQFQNNGSGVRGDFQAVLRKILMHGDARNALKIVPTPLADGTTRIQVNMSRSRPAGRFQGRLREPVLQTAHFIRFFEPDSYENETNTFEGYLKPSKKAANAMIQSTTERITVFGYYSAEYVATSGPLANRTRDGNPFVIPEFELLPQSFIPMTEGIRTLAENAYVTQNATKNIQNAPLVTLLNYSDIDETKNSFDWLISQLNIYMFYGTMKTQLQETLASALDNLTDATQEERFGIALAVLANSPDFAVAN